MKIAYLFSKNEKIGSKLIRWASLKEQLRLSKDEIPSHVAVLMNEEFVIESVLGKGVRMVPYQKWKQINQEVHKIPCTTPERSSAEVFRLLGSVWGKPYDWRGILFFGWAFIIMMINNDKRLPKKNPWQRDSHFFCSEFVSRLTNDDYSMITPAKLCDKLLHDEG